MAEDGARPEIKLASVFYEGKPLVIPGYQLHVSIQVTQILHKMKKMIPHLFEKFPQKFHDEKGLKLQEVLDVVDLYNKVAKPHANTWSGSYNEGILGEWGNPKCSDAVAEDIVMWAYGMGIKRPLDLNNHYKSFSAETDVSLRQKTRKIRDLARRHARREVSKTDLRRGDHLIHQQFDVRREVDVPAEINPSRPETGHQSDHNEASVRYSTNRFVGSKSRRYHALSETNVLTSLVGGVSWTQKAVPFYLTIMRQDKLEKYFEQKKTSEETERKPKRRREKEDVDSSGEKRKKTKRRRQESEDSEDSEDVTMSSTASLDSKTSEVSEIIVKDSEDQITDVKKDSEAPEVPPPLQKRETLVSILEMQFSPQKDSDDIVKESEDVETQDSPMISDVKKDSGAPNSIKMTPEDVEKAIAKIQMRSETPEASEDIVKDSEDVETSEAPNSIRMTPEYSPEGPPPLQKRVTLDSLLEAQFSPQKPSESPQFDLESKIFEIQMRSEAPDDVMTWLQTPESSILILDDEKMNPETPEDVRILKSIDFDATIETMTSDDVTNVLKSLEDSEDVTTSEVVVVKDSEASGDVKDSEVQEIDVNMDSEAPEVVVTAPEAPGDVKTPEFPVLNVVNMDSEAPEVIVKDSEFPVLNVVNMSSEAPEVVVKDSESSVFNVEKMDSKAPESVDVMAPESPVLNVKMDSEAPEVGVKPSEVQKIDVKMNSESPEVVDVKVISMTSDDMILKTSEIQEAPDDVTMVLKTSKAPEVVVKDSESPVFNVVNMDSEAPESVDVKVISMTSDDMILKTSEIQEAPDDVTMVLKTSKAPEVVVKDSESPVFNVVNMDSEAPESVDVKVISMTSDDMILKTSEIQEAPDDVTMVLKTSEAPEVVVKDSESPVFNVVNMDSEAPESVDVKVISMTSDDMILKTSEIQEAPDDVTMILKTSEMQEIDVKMDSESPVFNVTMDSEASGGEKIIQMDSEAPEVDVTAPESPIPNVKAPDDVTMVLRTLEVQDPEDVTAITKTPPRHQTIIEPPIDTEPSPLAPPPSSMLSDTTPSSMDREEAPWEQLGLNEEIPGAAGVPPEADDQFFDDVDYEMENFPMMAERNRTIDHGEEDRMDVEEMAPVPVGYPDENKENYPEEEGSDPFGGSSMSYTNKRGCLESYGFGAQKPCEEDEGKWTKRANHILKKVSSEIEASGSAVFSTITESAKTRKQAAEQFYSLLSLAKSQAITVEQAEPYGEIVIRAGNQFHVALTSSGSSGAIGEETMPRTPMRPLDIV